MTTYKNYEICPFAPDESSTTSVDYATKRSIVASVAGTSRVVDAWGAPKQSHTLTLFADGRESINQVREFIARRKGRVVPFWLPIPGLVAAAPASAGAKNLSVISAGFASNVFPTGTRRFIFASGQGNQIMAAAAGPNTDSLTLEDGLLAPIAGGQSVPFLVLCRLATDEVELFFEHANFMHAAIPLVELFREPADA